MAREMTLIDVLSSLRDGLRTLRAAHEAARDRLVVVMTTLVTLVGAAAMYYFENVGPGDGFKNYWDALYWTGMMMTNFGSGYWPVSEEGRVLAFLMAVYAFIIFGYTTATLATLLISREAQSGDSELSTSKSIQSLHDEVRALRAGDPPTKRAPAHHTGFISAGQERGPIPAGRMRFGEIVIVQARWVLKSALAEAL